MAFSKVEELKEKLWALAERRPADATKLLGQAFAGKKSLGEMASAPQTTDPNLKSAPPREFLNNTIVKDLTPALVQVYNKGSRRVVSDMGDMLMKGKWVQTWNVSHRFGFTCKSKKNARLCVPFNSDFFGAEIVGFC